MLIINKKDFNLLTISDEIVTQFSRLEWAILINAVEFYDAEFVQSLTIEPANPELEEIFDKCIAINLKTQEEILEIINKRLADANRQRRYQENKGFRYRVEVDFYYAKQNYPILVDICLTKSTIATDTIVNDNGTVTGLSYLNELLPQHLQIIQTDNKFKLWDAESPNW